jgi:drug/metabolite transporter (DMT)-like permease
VALAWGFPIENRASATQAVSFAMILGLGFAVVCALGTNVSSLFKARGAVLARPIRVRHPLRSATDLFRQRWFAIGWILALFAWGLHIEALALAPLSLVQAVLSGGLVFLAVLAERFFGYHLGSRQWVGVTLTAAGLAVIGLTATSEGPQRSSLAALIAVETAILALGIGLVRISTRRAIEHRREALLLAIAAGVLFGVSDVAIKYLTHAHGPVFGLLSPWTLTALISFVVSFYASARSLQIGLAIEVIAITSVAANLSAILGGVLVFGEPIGSGAIGIIGRLLAFGLVIAGAALVPAPLRATSNHPAQQTVGS